MGASDIYHLFLTAQRKLYTRLCGSGQGYHIRLDEVDADAQQTSDKIYSLLMSDDPCMVARYGSNELSCISNYLGVSAEEHSAFKYIAGKQKEWWWNPRIMDQMRICAGFFPPAAENLSKFSRLMLEDTGLLDVLGRWVREEDHIKDMLKDVFCTHLMYLEPFWCDKPWTRALEGRRILVVHPFAEEIESQYMTRRTRLFVNSDILPEFHLETIKAVQSLGGNSNGFEDWFAALEWMEGEIDRRDYDICLIGCGAYGFPLAAHCKRMGKKAVHLGGALQLLFGIRGKRWEDPMYGVKEWGIPEGSYLNLMNGYWVRPGASTRNENTIKVENGCYW